MLRYLMRLLCFSKNILWIISELVEEKQGKMMRVLKQNGYPVSLKGISSGMQGVWPVNTYRGQFMVKRTI